MPDSSKLEKLNRELEKSEKKLRKAINDEKALQHQLKQLISKETVIWFPGASVIWFRWRSLKTMTFGWRVGGARICRFCPIRGSTFPMKRRKSSLICFAA